MSLKSHPGKLRHVGVLASWVGEITAADDYCPAWWAMRWQRIDGKVMPALWEILPDIHTLCNIAFPCSAMCFYCAFYFGLLMENGTRGEEMSENMWLWKVRTEGCSSSWDLGAFRQKVRTRWESISLDSHWNANLSSLSCPILHVPHIALIFPWFKWGRSNPWVLQHVSQLVFVTGEFQPQEKSFKSQSIIGSWFKTKLPNYNSLSPPMLIV